MGYRLRQEAAKFVPLVLVIIVGVVLLATGWDERIIRWGGDLLLHQIEKMGSTQPG